MTKRRWKTPDVRRKLAVSMRSKGMSLRQIGAQLDVTEGTIRNDLRSWETEQVRNLLRNLNPESATDYAADYAAEQP